MTIQPTPYEIIRAIEDQQRATDRLVSILKAMLDRSEPDPVLSSAAAIPATVPAVRPAPATKRDRRQTGEAARPPVIVSLDGCDIRTTERRARLLETVRSGALTLTELARTSIAPTVAGVKAQIIDANADLERAGSPLRVVSTPGGQRIGARGGRNPSTYRLADPNASPDLSPATQNEGAAGVSPEQEAPECADGGGLVLPAQGAAFVTQTGASEGGLGAVPGESDPAPAADEELPETADETGKGAPLPVGDGAEPAKLAPDLVKPSAEPGGGYSVDAEAQKDSVDRTGRRNAQVGRGGAVAAAEPVNESAAAVPGRLASVALKPPSPRDLKLRIEPGDLIAVDVKAREVTTARGIYQVGGANLARALDRLKGGHLFGLDVIAKIAGWSSAEVAKTALGFERNRLAEHGIDLFMDKFNVRLREGS